MMTLKEIRLSTAEYAGDIVVDGLINIASKSIRCNVLAGSYRQDVLGLDGYCLTMTISIDAIAGNDELMEELNRVKRLIDEQE